MLNSTSFSCCIDNAILWRASCSSCRFANHWRPQMRSLGLCGYSDVRCNHFCKISTPPIKGACSEFWWFSFGFPNSHVSPHDEFRSFNDELRCFNTPSQSVLLIFFFHLWCCRFCLLHWFYLCLHFNFCDMVHLHFGYVIYKRKQPT